jgi:Na+-translocating ferredoxin:NAD+ oxidoreductase RnfC subunit
MIINGIDRDPYEKTSSLIINEYSSKILEATDALAKIFNIENTKCYL